MFFVQRDIHPREVRNYSLHEVNALIANIQAMGLPCEDPFLKVLEGRTFFELDRLFNGLKN